MLNRGSGKISLTTSLLVAPFGKFSPTWKFFAGFERLVPLPSRSLGRFSFRLADWWGNSGGEGKPEFGSCSSAQPKDITCSPKEIRMGLSSCASGSLVLLQFCHQLGRQTATGNANPDQQPCSGYSFLMGPHPHIVLRTAGFRLRDTTGITSRPLRSRPSTEHGAFGRLTARWRSLAAASHGDSWQ